jgi:hypothetical protein
MNLKLIPYTLGVGNIWQQEEQQSHGKGTNEFLKMANKQEVHIFLCTDDPDLRPIGVLINSTILNAK